MADDQEIEQGYEEVMLNELKAHILKQIKAEVTEAVELRFADVITTLKAQNDDLRQQIVDLISRPTPALQAVFRDLPKIEPPAVMVNVPTPEVHVEVAAPTVTFRADQSTGAALEKIATLLEAVLQRRPTKRALKFTRDKEGNIISGEVETK